MKTESEALFEQYCNHRNYPFSRIELPADFGRRADYRLHCDAGDIICEVKQIEDQDWERKVDERLRVNGEAEASRSIGTRARAVIRSAAPQLRAHKTESIPLVIFALDLTNHTHLSDFDIDAAMFGQPIVRFHSGNKNPSDDRSDFGHAGGRQMTEDERVYISAICVMNRKNLNLDIYHNPFATFPMFPRYFPCFDDAHYIKSDHPEKSGHHWSRCKPEDQKAQPSA